MQVGPREHTATYGKRRAKSEKGTQRCSHKNRETPGKSIEFGNPDFSIMAMKMQQFKAGIYMYVELQFTCTLEVGLFIANLEKSEAKSHAQ